jgi:ketosteroid isomerase-like protein
LDAFTSATSSTPTEREWLALSDNIEIITRFEHAFRAGDQETIDELGDPDLVDHNPAPDHEPTLAGFKQKVTCFKAIFPDLEEDLQDVIASGDIWTQFDGVAMMQQLGAIPA